MKICVPYHRVRCGYAPDVTKKIKEKIKQDLTTRYQDGDIKNVLHIFMYLDPRFKQLPMLTEIQKKQV